MTTSLRRSRRISSSSRRTATTMKRVSDVETKNSTTSSIAQPGNGPQRPVNYKGPHVVRPAGIWNEQGSMWTSQPGCVAYYQTPGLTEGGKAEVKRLWEYGWVEYMMTVFDQYLYQLHHAAGSSSSVLAQVSSGSSPATTTSPASSSNRVVGAAGSAA